MIAEIPAQTATLIYTAPLLDGALRTFSAKRMLPCELTNHSGVATMGRLLIATRLARVRVEMMIMVSLVQREHASDHPRFTKSRCQRPVFRLALWKDSVDWLNFLVPKMLDSSDFVGQVPES